ncbi:MAG TPA: hypothetical protein VF142_10025 [Longimicrobium sp.]
MSETIDGLVSPPSPPPASPPAGSPDGGGVSQTVQTETITNSTVTVAGEQNNFWVQEQVIQVSHRSRAAVRPFSCRDGLDVSEQEQETSSIHFHGRDGEIESLVAHLAERRVLLLSAERGAGKLSAAICLGVQLRQERKCSNGIMLADSLDRQVRIDVRHLAERDKGLAGRVVIFRKPFGRSDPELARLFEKTDRSGWEQLSTRLRQQNAYLVFTADPEDAAAFRDRVAAQGLLHELIPHPQPLLEAGLEEKLAGLEPGVGPQPLQALHAARELLLSSFHFTASLSEFVDFYVEHYQADLEVDEAIRRFHDTSEWLLQELERDFEFWTFGFTLALAQCVRDAQGVAWLDFDRLHRRLRQWLRRDMNRSSNASGDDDAEEGEVHPALSEAPLLRRCRAQIVKDSSTLADVIQFRDGAPPRRLWAVILERHRRALTTILPGLRELAESGQDDLRSLRELAAQILGRIGEVDPQRIVLPLLERWMRSDKGRHHEIVGPLFEGVMGSANERYRTLCFQYLRQVRRGAAAGDRAAVSGLHAAIAAYSWIGDYDLGLAMRELGEIAAGHLVPMIADVQQLARVLGDVENACRQQAKAGRDVDDILLDCHTLLRDLVALVYKQRRTTLLGMQATLVSLCLTAGAAPVFRELRRWIAEGGWKSGVLIALMFLHENGIANELKDFRVEVGAAGDGPANGLDPIVAAVGTGDEAVRQTARFVGDLYESLSTPHLVDAKLLRYCRDSLQDHLLGWVRDAVPVPEYATSMQALFAAMARTHDGILREPLVQLLSRREFSDPNEPRLHAFAAAVQF